MSIYNPVDARFDTVVELPPPSTDPQELTFRTSSLRHVSAERQLRFTVIADLEDGDAAELWIDFIGVEVIARGP
jgi:hypothetical protein